MENNPTAKLLAAALIGGGFYYLYSRTKIEIKNIDKTKGQVDYKVTLGFKEVEGTAYQSSQRETTHEGFGKLLTIQVKEGNIIDFVISNKKGEVLDHMPVEMSDNNIGIFTPLDPNQEVNISTECFKCVM